MNKRMEMHRLLGDLRYQLAPGAHTYSRCSRESCDNGARGGRVCADCLELEIDALLGDNPGYGLGGVIRQKYWDSMGLEAELLSMAEELDAETSGQD